MLKHGETDIRIVFEKFLGGHLLGFLLGISGSPADFSVVYVKIDMEDLVMWWTV